MNLTVDVDTTQLQEAMRKAPVKVTFALNTWINRTALSANREAQLYLKNHVSAGSSGITMSRIHTFPGKLKAEVKPTTKSAKWVHDGRRPGKMPPYKEGSDLNKWAKRIGMNPFLVARSIGRKGTKGHPFMTEAYKKIKPEAEREANKVLGEIVKSI